MISSENLISFHIIERESEKNLLVWTYPTIADDLKDFIVQKHVNTFTCYRKNFTWVYFKPQRNNTLIIITKDFSPIKYKSLLSVFEKKFHKTRNPVDLVKLYLSLFSDGSCAVQENGTTFSCDLKMLENSGISDFIKQFDVEVVLIYTAILLKRRVLVYCKNIEELQKNLLAITKLVPNRNLTEYLLPLIDSVKELKGLPFYVAGVTNPDFYKNVTLYDLFVVLDNLEISISPQAKETLTMTKIHKDLATFLVKLANESNSDEEDEIIRKITEKTDDLLEQLRSVASVTTENGVKMITLNDLKAKNFSQNLENFLFNLALAENIMML